MADEAPSPRSYPSDYFKWKPCTDDQNDQFATQDNSINVYTANTEEDYTYAGMNGYVPGAQYGESADTMQRFDNNFFNQFDTGNEQFMHQHSNGAGHQVGWEPNGYEFGMADQFDSSHGGQGMHQNMSAYGDHFNHFPGGQIMDPNMTTYGNPFPGSQGMGQNPTTYNDLESNSIWMTDHPSHPQTLGYGAPNPAPRSGNITNRALPTPPTTASDQSSSANRKTSGQSSSTTTSNPNPNPNPNTNPSTTSPGNKGHKKTGRRANIKYDTKTNSQKKILRDHWAKNPVVPSKAEIRKLCVEIGVDPDDYVARQKLHRYFYDKNRNENPKPKKMTDGKETVAAAAGTGAGAGAEEGSMRLRGSGNGSVQQQVGQTVDDAENENEDGEYDDDDDDEYMP